MKTIKNYIGCLAVALLVIIPLTTLANPIHAQAAAGSIGVSPSVISDSISSGGVKTYNITVNTGFALDVEVDGLGETPAGAAIGVSAQDDNSSLTARPWVSVNKNHLDAANTQTLTVTVNVPRGSAAGEHYAAILLQSQPGFQGSLDITSGILVPVIITVDQSSFRTNLAGQITDISANNPVKGAPIDFLISFSNMGNCLITNAQNKITLRDNTQRVIWQIQTPLLAPSVIPGYPRVIDVNYGAGLDVGYYSITSDITVPNGTLGSKTFFFTVSNAHPWDVNGDHICDVRDLGTVASNIGQTGAPAWIPADVNKDGVVDVRDLGLVATHIGQTW